MEVEKLLSARVALQRMMGSVVLGPVFAAQNSLVLLLFLTGSLPSDIDEFPHLSETEEVFLYGNLDKTSMSEESKNLGECVDDEDNNVDDGDDEDDYSGEGSNMDDNDAGSDEEVDEEDDDEEDDDDDDSDEEDHQRPPKKKR